MAKIKDIPIIDRPRERFLKKGADALSKSDLLAILLVYWNVAKLPTPPSTNHSYMHAEPISCFNAAWLPLLMGGSHDYENHIQ